MLWIAMLAATLHLPSDTLLGTSLSSRPDTQTVALSGHPAADTVARRLDGSVDWARVFTITEPADSQQPRRRAVQYSDGYYKRLGVHRAMSYAMIPLFVGSFVTGNALYDGSAPEWERKLHKPLAVATGVVFSVNTVTGLLNLIESNKNPEGRTKRWIHGLSMIVADAGFTYAGAVLGPEAKRDPDRRGTHRAVALGSMGLSLANWTFMWLTK
ncbi:MAG: hypothetical protein AB7L66_10360 [Gemmatimonadales bacterium]